MAKIKIANDNISKLLGGVDPKFNDSDDFMDIVQWNLRWFNSKEKERVKKIEKVLSVLNSDIFVFQEVAENSLDEIAASLTASGKGTYQVTYGTTGGQQRVAIMWDMDWVRTKDDTIELFGKKSITTPSGKDVFPRLPLWSYLYCKSTISKKRGFDFQLVGLHLKSQMDRSGQGDDELQRTLSAAKLADWLLKEANNFDADTILLGDWNQPPEAKAWSSFHALEKDNRVNFTKINDSTNFSHLYYRNKSNVGSLLDLRVVTTPFATQMNKKMGVIKWIALEDLLASDASAGEIKKIIAEIKSEITDHLPVLTRFGVSRK
jgi:endonuclease/exonuclease/phosphatase family metal-dependent hydrolase